PSSRTLRARPRRFATSGAWRVAKGLRGSGGVYGLERRGRRAVVGGGGAGSEAIRGAIRRADAGQDANAVPGGGRSSGGGELHRVDRRGHVSPGRLFWRWGTLSTEIWIIPLVAIALTQTAVVATSVYLHRTLAHRALAVHPVADVLFRTVLWLTTGQLRQEWVAVHRKHHAFILAPLINSVGHWRGAQNFGNTAYNSSVLAWVTGGESLHNNHHAHPRAPKFSVRRVEFDPSWLVIRLLAALGLVVVVGPPVSLSSHGRATR